MATIGELKKHLASYRDSTHCAYALWLPDDVRSLKGGKKLKKDEVDRVLDDTHHHHDATIGINWDVLGYNI